MEKKIIIVSYSRATPVDFDEDMAIDLEHPAPRFASIFEDEIVEWICNVSES